LHELILAQLGQLQFATPEQLAKLCGAKASNVSVACKELLNSGLIDGSLLTRPMILGLTPAGGRMLGVPLPSGRRHSSWSVMAHACHLNAAGNALALTHKGFCFLPRLTLLKQGFNPGHGEHGATDDSGTAWFVLLDDYMMGSDRIARAWTRRHTPNAKYWPDPTGRAWCEVVQKFLVVCTNEEHAARHRAWIQKARLPADVVTIKPLWKT
jgi:hypothetical protein